MAARPMRPDIAVRLARRVKAAPVVPAALAQASAFPTVLLLQTALLRQMISAAVLPVRTAQRVLLVRQVPLSVLHPYRLAKMAGHYGAGLLLRAVPQALPILFTTRPTALLQPLQLLPQTSTSLISSRPTNRANITTFGFRMQRVTLYIEQFLIYRIRKILHKKRIMLLWIFRMTVFDTVR